jgi:hypothetical protein
VTRPGRFPAPVTRPGRPGRFPASKAPGGPEGRCRESVAWLRLRAWRGIARRNPGGWRICGQRALRLQLDERLMGMLDGGLAGVELRRWRWRIEVINEGGGLVWLHRIGDLRWFNCCAELPAGYGGKVCLIVLLRIRTKRQFTLVLYVSLYITHASNEDTRLSAGMLWSINWRSIEQQFANVTTANDALLRFESLG